VSACPVALAAGHVLYIDRGTGPFWHRAAWAL